VSGSEKEGLEGNQILGFLLFYGRPVDGNYIAVLGIGAISFDTAQPLHKMIVAACSASSVSRRTTMSIKIWLAGFFTWGRSVAVALYVPVLRIAGRTSPKTQS
jgi:hypothetical protein